MKPISTTCHLDYCFLCRFCLKEWREVLAIKKQYFEFKKGQKIFEEGQPVQGIFFVYTGKVKVHKRWDKEKELIIRFAQGGDILGHLGLGDDSFYPVTATALEKVRVCYLEMDFFETTLKVNPELTYRLMRFFANELQGNEKKMRDLVHMPVKARIAQSLLSLKKQFGLDENGFINIELTKQDLSSFAGAAYETLFKVMVEFVNQQKVETVDKRFRLKDEEFLIELTRAPFS